MPSAGKLTRLAILTFSPLLWAQTPPTAYTITQVNGAMGTPITATVSRNGSKALIETSFPAQSSGDASHRTLTLYDLNSSTSYSWDPAASPINCSAGSFSGDWGDPFAMTADLSAEIAKGNLKATGAETVSGMATKVFTGGTAQASMKVWLDEKDHLVIRAMIGAPGGPMQTLADIRKVSFTPPPASLLTLPAACAGLRRPPTPEEQIAAETGDSAANFAGAIYGPGSKDSCNVLLRVVRAGTMEPVTHKFQVAVDTAYNVDNPPHYSFGMANDGAQTFAGGGIREITNQIRNGMVRIDNPPAYFNLSVNLIKPGSGAGMGLIYRQCFAPTTVLYYVVKDPENPAEGGDWLWAKAGKYAAVPAR